MSSPHLVVHTAKRPDGGAGRYGLVVSRKVGGAVVRNRLRRQVRAAIELAGGVRDGFDAVFVVRPGAVLQVSSLSREIWQIMEGVGSKGGNESGRRGL